MSIPPHSIGGIFIPVTQTSYVGLNTFNINSIEVMYTIQQYLNGSDMERSIQGLRLVPVRLWDEAGPSEALG